MKGCGEVFIGIDTAKARNAVAVADAGRDGEVRYLREFDNTLDAIAKLVSKLAGRHKTLHFCKQFVHNFCLITSYAEQSIRSGYNPLLRPFLSYGSLILTSRASLRVKVL